MNLDSNVKPLYADSILIEPTGRTLGSTNVPTYTLKIAVGKEWITTEPVTPECVGELEEASTDLKGIAFTFVLAEKKVLRKFVVNTATKIHR
jgi:hypothetical protein